MERLVNELRKELVGKELTFGEIENKVSEVFNVYEKDSFFNGNMYEAFTNMSHSYEIGEDEWVNINFETDTENDFDIYEDKVKVVGVEII